MRILTTKLSNISISIHLTKSTNSGKFKFIFLGENPNLWLEFIQLVNAKQDWLDMDFSDSWFERYHNESVYLARCTYLGVVVDDISLVDLNSGERYNLLLGERIP